ncbi:MAG: hypothetical protein DRP93_06530 [Candidatus Neomarinimicrobiota bacterium]|nr:MAG: hypothetical protein DRP93_06530 [Candidatus Neomarinimicrobiota bacterium]
MLNIHDLERRWLRYKIKSYIPLFIGSLTAIIALVLVLIYLPFSKEETPVKPKEEVAIVETVTVIETPTETIVKEEIIETVDINVPQNTTEKNIITNTAAEVIPPKVEQNTLVLKPSLHFMDNIENTIPTYIDEEYVSELPTEVNMKTKTETVSEPKVIQAPRKSGLTIKTKSSKDDLKDVIRRFKQNKNPALSLFIAKRYYADGKYQRSYNYALMTNEIDKHIDESWIIFAKSLVKLGQHELASNTLKTYLKTTKSSAAKVLLRKIDAGTFR